MTTLNLKSLQAQIDEMKQIILNQGSAIIELQNQLKNMPKGRDRGPASEGDMTEAHAIRVMLGDMKEISHKECAILLKLSYGQIYSARKGFTFKSIYKRMERGEVDHTYDDPTTFENNDKDILAAKAVEALEQIQDQQEGEDEA